MQMWLHNLMLSPFSLQPCTQNSMFLWNYGYLPTRLSRVTTPQYAWRESSQESDLPHQLNPIKSSWASVNTEQYCDVLETVCLYHSITHTGLMQPSCQWNTALLLSHLFKITVISMTHTRTLSKADGLPPLCTCPSTVILVSCCRFSTTTCLTFSAVIGSPSWSMAPSATIMIFSRCPVERSYFIQPRNIVRKGEWK